MEEQAPLRVAREYGETLPVETLQVADSIRTDTWHRPITEDERIAYGEQVISLSMKVDNKEDEKREMVKMITADIKEAKASRKDVLTVLKNGTVEEVDRIHTFLDHDHYRVFEYNSKGELVATRRMLPQERQINAF